MTTSLQIEKPAQPKLAKHDSSILGKSFLKNELKINLRVFI
jgi:hypothetical protein